MYGCSKICHNLKSNQNIRDFVFYENFASICNVWIVFIWFHEIKHQHTKKNFVVSIFFWKKVKIPVIGVVFSSNKLQASFKQNFWIPFEDQRCFFDQKLKKNITAQNPSWWNSEGRVLQFWQSSGKRKRVLKLLWLLMTAQRELLIR